MTRVSFLRDSSGTLLGYTAKGHSGFSEQGSDIVCAAVSSAAYMAANTVTDIIGDGAEASAEDGSFYFLTACPSEKSVTVLDGLRLHMEGLAEQYPDNLTIKSRKVK